MGVWVDWWDEYGCFIQLNVLGIPLRSILENTVNLFWVSGNGCPVLESIRLRSVCDTCKEYTHSENLPLGLNLGSTRGDLLTCTTNWLHHKIAWCSIDNQTFLMPVLLIIKPWVGGTILSRVSNFDRTWKKKIWSVSEQIQTHQIIFPVFS